MGTWGIGVFSSDEAGDVLQDVRSAADGRVAQVLDELVRDELNAEWSNGAVCAAVATVLTLAALPEDPEQHPGLVRLASRIRELPASERRGVVLSTCACLERLVRDEGQADLWFQAEDGRAWVEQLHALLASLRALAEGDLGRASALAAPVWRRAAEDGVLDVSDEPLDPESPISKWIRDMGASVHTSVRPGDVFEVASASGLRRVIVMASSYDPEQGPHISGPIGWCALFEPGTSSAAVRRVLAVGSVALNELLRASVQLPLRAPESSPLLDAVRAAIQVSSSLPKEIDVSMAGPLHRLLQRGEEAAGTA
ncbi:MAG: DUF4259 domain-containing protein [Planctomycetota bacterium]